MPFMGFFSIEPALAALLAVSAPIVTSVTNHAASGALAPVPFVLFVTSFAASGTPAFFPFVILLGLSPAHAAFLTFRVTSVTS
jgi:hypothetical protein